MTKLTVAAMASSAVAACATAACGGSRTDAPSPAAAVRPAAVTPAQGAPRRPPRGVVENCSTRSKASFPGAFSNGDNVVVGPLALVGAAHTPPSTVREYGGDKFPALVAAGHRVTVALSNHTRRFAGLGYGPLPQGVELSPGDGHRAVTFIACGRAAGPATFWSGFVLIRSPRCVPLEVWVDDERSPRRVVLAMGPRRCP